MENAVPFDVSDLKSVSVAVSVAVLLAIGRLTIVPATAKEGAARCRAIRHGVHGTVSSLCGRKVRKRRTLRRP